MRFISIIAIICIFIELWHIVYYTFLYEKYFKPAENVITWSQSYDKLHKHFMNFADYYVNNEELHEALGTEHYKVIKRILDLLGSIGGPTDGKHKILSLRPMKELVLFLFQQSIEIIYLLLILNLAVIMPGISGCILLIILLSLSTFQKHYNKDKNCVYLNIDSLFCIIMFAMIACRFFCYY